jgi:alkaline phosphatase D
MRLLLPLLVLLAVPSRAAEPLTRIAFGSCCRENRPQPVWEAVRAGKPELLLLLGDNIYGDTEDMEVLRAKYRMLGENPGFAALRAECPVRAVWDDHDYGKNDAGKEYPMKRESQAAFLDFFQVPADDPRRTREGTYFAETFGPPGRRVQVIGLDTRYFRDPLDEIPKAERTRLGMYRPATDTSRTLLGAAQWTWLESVLREPAEIRLILSSVQFVSSDHLWEGWGTLPHERTRMVRLLRDTGARGVIFLSGDRHRGEISRDDQHPDRPYPLYDLTSSGLNQGGGGHPEEPNRHRIGEPVLKAHYGTLDIDWSATPPRVTARLRLVDGTEAQAHTFAAP